MAKENGKTQKLPAKYRQVVISEIRRGRRGKHHGLIGGIFEELDSLPQGSAIKIPLSEVDGTSLANLRSAVHRESTTRGIGIETLSDDQNFYIWRVGK